MQFESAVKRNFIISILLGFIPDLILSGLVATLMHGGLLGFALVFLGIELLPFPIWLVRSLFGWALYSWNGKRAMANHFLEDLRRNGFPFPADSEKSAEDYFQRIADDESLPLKLRRAADREYITFVLMRAMGELQQLFKISFAYELAIQDYSNESPTKKTQRAGNASYPAAARDSGNQIKQDSAKGSQPSASDAPTVLEAWPAAPLIKKLENPQGKVLVVDNDADVGGLFAIMLNALNYESDVCAGVEEALEHFSPAAFDVAVISAMLHSGKSGIKLAKDLRGRDADLKIIIISANPAARDDAKATDPRVEDYVDAWLSKPVRSDDFKKTVADLTTKRGSRHRS